MTRSLISQATYKQLLNTTSPSEAVLIIKISSDLGIKLMHMKEWTELFYRLIPSNTDYTSGALLKRVYIAREQLDCISKKSGGLYSTSALWSQIINHLLSE